MASNFTVNQIVFILVGWEISLGSIETASNSRLTDRLKKAVRLRKLRRLDSQLRRIYGYQIVFRLVRLGRCVEMY